MKRWLSAIAVALVLVGAFAVSRPETLPRCPTCGARASRSYVAEIRRNDGILVGTVYWCARHRSAHEWLHWETP